MPRTVAFISVWSLVETVRTADGPAAAEVVLSGRTAVVAAVSERMKKQRKHYTPEDGAAGDFTPLPLKWPPRGRRGFPLNDSAQARWLKTIEVFNGGGESKQLKLFHSDVEPPAEDADGRELRLRRITEPTIEQRTLLNEARNPAALLTPVQSAM